MKRFITSLISLALALSLVGCENTPFIETDYKVVSNQNFDFDFTPTDDPFLEDGYIVKENGLFGFINIEGEYVMKPEYESVYINRNAYDSKSYIYMFKDKNNEAVNTGEALAYYLGYIDEIVCGVGIGGTSGLTFVDKDNHIFRFNPNILNSPTLVNVTEDFKGYKMLIPKIYEDYTEETLKDYKFKDWYIVTKDRKTMETKLFGPYKKKETNFFRTTEWDSDYRTLEIEFDTCLYAHGMFYESKKDGYKIWNEDGTESFSELVDEVIPLSWNAMKIRKNGKLGVVDENLNLVLYGDFEDVSKPIDNRAYVKVNGVWKLIQLNT